MRPLTSRKTFKIVLIVCLLSLLTACGSVLFQRRTLYVPDGEPGRLREAVHAKVWVYVPETKEWEPSEMLIPEGWYAVARSANQADQGK
jgi:major membrane immunogen (membrane-anchored lipoprotein)